MDNRKRVQFINSLSGFKSANMIGTSSRKNDDNLAIISSVVHLGTNPPLLGFILRPHSVDRHTLDNIKDTGVYTVNQVHADIFKPAHQTSARYNRDQSEFEETGLTAERYDGFHAPFVSESNLSMGIKLVEVASITHNGTEFVIGEIQWVRTHEKAIQDDGLIDLEALNTVTVSGLDRYHTTSSLGRLSYAKPDQQVREIPLAGLSDDEHN
ncbi:MAG: flavin reductase family protein [Pseudomonadota bacterium]